MTRTPARSGSILLAVLVAVVLSTMTAVGLMYRMRAESSAAAAAGAAEQGHWAAMSGLQKAIIILGPGGADVEAWYDNEEAFHNQFVADDGAERWYFTVYAHNDAEPDQVRYGLTDQASKININTADEETLLALPNMTRDLVHCLMDFRDRDDEPMDQGAEQDYYDQLATPYLVKNSPFVSVEELLLVKGFNGSVVYGDDANLNSLLDANEDDGQERFPPDDADGQLNRGLKGSAVAISYEPNVDSEGEGRVNINGGLDDLDKAGLDSPTEEFIRLYRGEGNLFEHAAELLNMRYRLKNDTGGSGGQHRAGDWIESGVDRDNLDVVMDKLTTQPSGAGKFLMGLLNVNTASVGALSALGQIDDSLAGQIVDARADLDADARKTTAWLYTQDVLDEQTFKAVAAKLTTRGYQFHLRCVAFAWPSGRFRVIEAVVDLAGPSPRVTYLRDLTRLGLPFAIDVDKERGS